MDILATRVLSYPDDYGDERELVLTIFMPFEAEDHQWKCGFMFGPPIDGKIEYGVDIDFIKAFLNSLTTARGALEGTGLFGRLNWQGMLECGLLEFAEEPAWLDPDDVPPLFEVAGSMDVLTTRTVGYRDESGVERKLPLTIFVPFKADGDVWKCGFTFDPLPSVKVRYGVGTDFIEALLDGLAKARATFEGAAPKGWKPSEEQLDCSGFPCKVGPSFWRDPVGPPPDMP